MDEAAITKLVDEIVFGSLQGMLDGNLDLGKIAEELSNVDMDNLMKGDL